MSTELLITIGAIVAGVILFLVLRRVTGSGDHEWESSIETMERDWDDPLRRWTRCVFSIVTRNYDYAYRPAWTRSVVEDSWGFEERSELYATLEELDDDRDQAWNLVRYCLVARMGVGCGLIDNDVSWGLIRPVANRLQANYDSFADIAESYVEGRRAWRKQAADDAEDVNAEDEFQEIDRTVQILKRELWPRVRYDEDLSKASRGADRDDERDQ